MKQGKKTIQTQKIAIAHDSYLYEGGAERVLTALLELFPQAELYIPLIHPPFLQKLRRQHTVHTSWLNHFLLPEKYASFLKPLVRKYWQSLDFTKYDLVISSSHSFSAKSVVAPKPTLHLSYIHTPPRYLYEERNEMVWLKNPFFQKIFGKLLQKWRALDFQAAQQPDVLITNSKTTQARIKKYYRRSSVILSPPVFIPRKIMTGKKKYYLFHSRLVAQKGGELVVRTFNKLKKPLLIVGTGEQEKKLKNLARENVVFAGFVPDNKLAKIYSQAKALVFTGIDEDFGLAPVEAMAHGIPVVAYNSGGIRETIVTGKTGLLFDVYSIESLAAVIAQFEQHRWPAKACIQQARRFSAQKFKRGFLEILKKAQHTS